MPDLIAFCDKMSGFVDEEGAVAVLYLAFSQAFISVSHSTLVTPGWNATLSVAGQPGGQTAACRIRLRR